VWKSDGAGDSDVEAEKGAVSDAFKRAAVKWGVGRYLYDLDSPWVALEKRGNSYAIAKSEEARLAKLIVAVNARLTGITPSPPERSQSSAHGRALAAEEPQLIDHTRKKGEMPAAANTNPGFGRPPTIEEARAAKIKAGVDKRVNALNMRNDWTRAELDQFWKDNEGWISWMADANNKALREYQRFTDAFANAETNMRDVA
jgi:hypothetical protein